MTPETKESANVTRSPADIIAAALCVPGPDGFCGRPNQHRRDAEAALAALAGEGWGLYRPDECAEVECLPNGLEGEQVNFNDQYLQVRDTRSGTLGTMPSRGTYRLVPAEGEK